MKTIGFIGLGLIGGSISKALKKSHPDYHILAFDNDRDNLAAALSEGVIDGVVADIRDEHFMHSDYLFLCTPVEFNLLYLEIVAPYIGEHTVITDVGSVKGGIHQKAAELHLDHNFIGGHPMAGSEKSGYKASNERILENAYYVITPGVDTSLEKIGEFQSLVDDMGAIPIVLTPEEHDYITAGISHLPHIIASSLVNLVKNLDNEGEYMKTLAAGGFRDITRIASSSPVMWQHICLENQANISSVLDEYIRMLINIRCDIDEHSPDAIYNMFESSRNYRDSIDVFDNGPIKKDHTLYIDLADEAGGIATIATILAMEKISIKNIGIIHNREFEQGVLKVEFYDAESQEHGAALLRKRNYTIYER